MPSLTISTPMDSLGLDAPFAEALEQEESLGFDVARESEGVFADAQEDFYASRGEANAEELDWLAFERQGGGAEVEGRRCHCEASLASEGNEEAEASIAAESQEERDLDAARWADNEYVPGQSNALLLGLNALLEAEAGAGTGLADKLVGVTGFLLGPNLRRGEKGATVSALQSALIKVGYDLAVDGDFGPNTDRAVRDFQRRSSLSVDGIVGAATKAALAAEIAQRTPTPPLPSPAAPPPPQSPAFATLDPGRWRSILQNAYRGTAALQSGNAVKFLVDGGQTFAEMVAAIRRANAAGHFIYLLGWVCIDDFALIPGDNSTTLRALFSAAAGAGVQIRAMFWQQISGTSCLKRNEDAVRFINGLPTGAAILDNETLLKRAGIKTGTHHQKVLVVQGRDGLVAFCGGVDVNSDRITTGAGCQAFGSGVGGDGHPLHDVHCRIVGPSAYDLLRTFLMRWQHNPESDRIDPRKGKLIGFSTNPPAPLTLAPAPASSVPRTCSVGIARTFLPANVRLGPRRRECNIRRLLLASIAEAQRFIYMEDQYLISIEAARALNAAAPRLQHITILTTASEIASDLRCPWRLRRDFLTALTAGLSSVDAAKIGVFHLSSPKTPQGSPRFGAHTYVHAKCWVFDDELAVIGSANCNKRGWETDSEVNAFVFDDSPVVGAPVTASAPTFAQALRMSLWAEHLVMPGAALTDGVASVQYWRSPNPLSRIGPYAPSAGSDPRLCIPADILDPGLPCAT